jgi:hypothetical protein
MMFEGFAVMRIIRFVIDAVPAIAAWLIRVNGIVTRVEGVGIGLNAGLPVRAAITWRAWLIVSSVTARVFGRPVVGPSLLIPRPITAWAAWFVVGCWRRWWRAISRAVTWP